MIIGFIFFTINIIHIERNEIVARTIVDVNFIGEYCSAAMDFGYPKKVEEVLEKLKLKTSVISGQVYGANDSLFAFYRQSDSITIPKTIVSKSDYYFENDYLYVIEPIVYKTRKCGTTFIKVDTHLQDRINKLVFIMGLLLIFLILVSYILAYFMQKIVSNPILLLANTTNDITNRSDYSVRVSKKGNDEISVLYNAFNSMLAVIQKREQERDLAENQLRQSHQRIKNIMNAINDAIFVHSLENGKILDVNNKACEMYGYERNEILNIDVETLSSGQTPYSQNEAIQWIMKSANGEPQIFPWHAKRKDGSLFWAEVNMKIANIDGFNRTLVVVRDITERKKAEEEIKRAKNYVLGIINSMPSVIFSIDSSCRIVQCNIATEIYTNQTFQQMQNMLLFDVFLELNAYKDKIQQSLDKVEIIYISKIEKNNGTEQSYEDLTIYPLMAFTDEGAVIRIENITEKVRLEELMIQSEKMLSVGGLAAGMAHEINNPLAGILQNTNVLSNRLTNNLNANVRDAQAVGIEFDKIIKYVERRGIVDILNNIREAGSRAAKIVQNMLSFARKSEGIGSKHSMPELLDKTIELAKNDYDLKKKYDFRQIKIMKEYEDNLPTISCEGSKLQQVFLNLMKNGAEAMFEVSQQRVPTFHFRIKRDETMLRIEIEDNGCGMDEQVRKRIMEPFFTTKSVGTGTGLGLSISYFIITENHKGTLEVESELDKGTRFIIRLPL